MLAPDAHPLLPADLIACHECDLLQREPALAPGETARCGCIRAVGTETRALSQLPVSEQC